MRKGYKIYTAIYYFKVYHRVKVMARTHKKAEINAINNKPKCCFFEKVEIHIGEYF